MDTKRLKQNQHLISHQVNKVYPQGKTSEAIAIFDGSHHLVVFNQKLADMWGLSPDWLQERPHYQAIFTKVVEQGYWTTVESDQIGAAFQSNEDDNFYLYIEQTNSVCLEVYTTLTSDGGWLFTFRDITGEQNSQAILNGELRRQAFLLGLMERLQPATELRDIGQFALSYLVQTMDAAFGDVKVVTGEGTDKYASVLTNQIAAEFIATYGLPAVANMEAVINQGIPYGQGLLWEVVETGKPVFIEDYKTHPNAIPEFRHPGIGQLGIFPIPAANGTIIGLLTLESRSCQKLQDAPQQDMLLAACRMLGVAIERAQAQERLRHINEDLERASQLKSEFLASMSHELRTPLNSILGFSDLLTQEVAGSLNERQKNYVQVIESSGQHLLSLINDILDLSKIESGKAELELSSVDIRDICSQCLKMIQPRADKKRLALSLELDYRLELAHLDERRVRQMLINLLSNAVKFTPENGQIKLSYRLAYGGELEREYRPDRSPVNASTPYLCLEVKDTGIGIAQSKWHLLFRPFQQIDASLSRHHEGTGLGLALTKRLAELHSGTVSLQSVENQGSTFRIWLPLTEMREDMAGKADKARTRQGEKPRNNSPSLNTNSSAKRVLVVEDQPLNQALITEVLELEGYIVEVIYNGRTMQEMIYCDRVRSMNLPDLILMDIHLPEVDGFNLLRQLKAHSLWQRVPVIAVTAMAMAGDRNRCFAAGANAYLSKPLDLDLLRKLVRGLLSNE